jgi:hypothetical protein
MFQQIVECFEAEKYLYSQHAREGMETEELEEIKDEEVFEAVLSGKIIEDYPEDEPYPRPYLWKDVWGKTTAHCLRLCRRW